MPDETKFTIRCDHGKMIHLIDATAYSPRFTYLRRMPARICIAIFIPADILHMNLAQLSKETSQFFPLTINHRKTTHVIDAKIQR
jgi:hypothetical protein